MHRIVVTLIFLFASSLSAQPLSVGTMPSYANGSVFGVPTAPVTWVNLSNPASVTGTVDRASVNWTKACSGAFKIVFFHGFTSMPSYNVAATRGPFDAVVGVNLVNLTPPVAVQAGDLIGIVQLQPYSACGSPGVQNSSAGDGYVLVTNSDMSVSPLGTASGYGPGTLMGLIAYASSPLLVRVLPAAGSVQGAGAFFRTSLQLLNPGPTPISGKLVFHKQGVSASADDPSLAFTLNVSQVRSYPDIVSAMGTSGLGSLDVFTDLGAGLFVTARVFSDGGNSGTFGFTEEGLDPKSALATNTGGVILIPPDLTNFRMNIGVRTLGATTIRIETAGANGTLHGERSLTLPANYFQQFTASEFAGTSTLEAGGWILVSNDSYPGSIFVYATVTDNRTQDSSMRMASVN